LPSPSPREALLQTLEIQDLLLTFTPGVVDADFGLELRGRARARGYAAHFNVGPANGSQVSFRSTNSFISNASTEDGGLYGPAAAEWLHEGFGELMTRGEFEQVTPATVTSEGFESIGSGRRVMLTGSPFARGYQRGLIFGAEIRAAYEQRVLKPIREGSIEADLGVWSLLRGAADPAPLALVDLSDEALELMRGLAESDLEELQGLADAAELPFLAVWLLQTSSYFREDPEESKGVQDALFAITNGRSTSDGVLVAHTLAGGRHQQHIVAEIFPDSGHGYVAVGAPWELGVFSAMNDAGLVICVEPAPDLGPPKLDAPPIGFVVRAVLSSETRLEDAVASLMASEGQRGYRILVADRSPSDAAVIEFGAKAAVRTSLDGLLFSRQELPASGRRSRGHSSHISSKVRNSETMGLSTLQAMLLKGPPVLRAPGEEMTQELGPCIVFETGARRLHLSFKNDEGVMGPFHAVAATRERR